MNEQRTPRWISESDCRLASYKNSKGDRYYRSMKTLLIISLIVFFAAPSYGWVSYYPNSKTGDCATYNIPTLPRPDKWGTYVDPTFGITVRRFTNWYYEYGPGGKNQYDDPPIIQYSTFTNTNADNTKVVFKIGDRIGLFYTIDGTFLRYKNFGSPGSGDMELRWSYFNPDVMYYRQQTRFYKYNYSTDSSMLLRNFMNDFPTATGISNNDKGEQSWTPDEYFAFRVTGTGGDTGGYLKLVCYKPSTNEMWVKDVAQYYTERGIDHLSTYPRAVSMSPSGKYLIAYFGGALKGSTTGSQSHAALFARTAPGVLSYVRNVSNYQVDHMAHGYAHEGFEAIWAFSEPANTIKVLDTGLSVDEYNRCHDCASALPCVYPTGHGKHQSSSPAIKNGWRIISTYSNSNSYMSDYWLDRMVYAVRSSQIRNNVIIWRLAHVQSTASKGYNDQSRTQISRDGKYIYFDSNWMGTDPHTREIYRLEMPDNWWNLIEAGDPPTKVIQPAIDTSPPAAPIITGPPAAPGGLKIIK